MVDLGKQVPVETIMAKAVEEQADAIGLSALLVSTSQADAAGACRSCSAAERALPVLIGGAAINRAFGRRILFAEEQRPTRAGCFTARTPSRDSR